MNNNKRTINIISNRNIESKKTKYKLIEELDKYGLMGTENYDKNAELNVCIGGDGSFLRAIHRNKFPPIPFIGINTGHLGFFQEISPTSISDFVKKYVSKEYTVEEILLLNTLVRTKKKNFNLTSINEIVVKGSKSKVVHLTMYIDDNHLQKFSGDGIIVSTPAGSTAYNFSSGGSIVYPSINCLQVTPVAPISSKAFRSLPTSIIVPGDLNISIKPEYRYKNSILIVNDGMEYWYDDIIDISFNMSNKKIYQLKFSKDYYWENLKNKFL